MSFTTNSSNLSGKSTTNAFDIVANSLIVNKNTLVKGDLTVLGNTNIGNVTLENANVNNLTVANLTATNPIPTSSGGTGLATIGSPNQVLQVNPAGTALYYSSFALSNPSTITGTTFTGNPTFTFGIETASGSNGQGFVRTSSAAFGLDIQTQGTGKYIKLESDTVSLPTNTTPSTSTSTGALVVTGDVGIGGKINLGSSLTTSSSITSYSSTAQFVNVSDTINLGPFGLPTSLITAAGRIAMAGVLQLPAPNPFTDNSALTFQPATGSFVAFGYPDYSLTLSSGSANTTIGPQSAATSYGISALINNTVYSFVNTLVAIPIPIGAAITNTVVGFKSGVARGGFCKTSLRNDIVAGAQLIDITAEGGPVVVDPFEPSIGTIGNINIFASGGLAGSQIRIATLGSNTAGVLINPNSGGVNLSPTAGGVTANPTAGGILLQAQDTSNINIQTGTAFYPSPSASGNVIISSASGSVSIDASQQMFTVGYIAALPGSTSIPVGSNLCGAIALIANNGSAAFATGNIDIYTSATGINTGPGNITLNTTGAYTGLMNFQTKGMITFETVTGADLVTIDPVNFQYRFHNSGGGHALSLDRTGAIFTFPGPKNLSRGFLAVNVSNEDGGSILSLYNPSLTPASLLSTVLGKNDLTGNAVQNIFDYYSDGDYRNNITQRFIGTGLDFMTVQKGYDGIALSSVPVITFAMYQFNLLFVIPGYSISFSGANMTSNYTWKWPETIGGAGQILTSNGVDGVSWTSVSGLGYVTSVTATSPLSSSGGSAPVISIQNSPSFTGAVTCTNTLGTSPGLAVINTASTANSAANFQVSSNSTAQATAPISSFYQSGLATTQYSFLAFGKSAGLGLAGQLTYTYNTTIGSATVALGFSAAAVSAGTNFLSATQGGAVTIAAAGGIAMTLRATITNNAATTTTLAVSNTAVGANSIATMTVASSATAQATAPIASFYQSGLATTQYSFLAFGKSAGLGLAGQLTYTSNTTIANATVALGFSNTAVSAGVNFLSATQGGAITLTGTTTVNGATTVTGSLSSFSSSLLTVSNTNTSPAFTFGVLAPSIGADQTIYSAIGKAIGPDTCAYLSFTNTTVAQSTWSIYNSSTNITFQNNGFMQISGSPVNISGNTGITGSLSASGSTSSYSNALFTITNTNTNPLFTATTLAPNMAIDATIFWALGKSTGTGGSGLLQYQASATPTFIMTMYNSSTAITMQQSGTIVMNATAMTFNSATAGSININVGGFQTPTNINTGSSNGDVTIGSNQSLGDTRSNNTYIRSNVSCQGDLNMGGTANGSFYMTTNSALNQTIIYGIDSRISVKTDNTYPLSIISRGSTTNFSVIRGLNPNWGANANRTVNITMGYDESNYNSAVISFTNRQPNIGTRDSVMSFGYYGFPFLTTDQFNCAYFFDGFNNLQVSIMNNISRTGLVFQGDGVITGRGIQTTDVNFMKCIGTAASAFPSGYFIVFKNEAGTDVGSIFYNGANTIFSTSSDYRLKENIKPISNALSKVNQLNPVTYSMKESKINTYGFIAHEVQAIIPELVSGEKDELDEEGKPRYQQIDYSRFTPYTVAAIKELYSLINTLQSEIAILKQLNQ